MRKKTNKVVTVFPKGTVVKYDGLPCELLQDTPYYCETINARLNVKIAPNTKSETN